MFYICNLIFYGFTVYFTFLRYKAFRMSGGLKKDSKHEKLLDNDSKKGKKKEVADTEKGKSPTKTTAK